MTRWCALIALAVLPAWGQMVFYTDLSGPWRSTEQDDPAMAEPSYDDRQWSTTQVPVDNVVQFKARWLRRRVELPAAVWGSHLTLTLGAVGYDYRVYVNGRQVGTLAPASVDEYQIRRPRNFDFDTRADEPSLVIAIRYAGEQVRGMGTINPPDAGPWLLTSASVAPRDAGLRSLERHRLRRLQDVAQPLVLFFLACIAWLVWFRERSQSTVFWLAVILTVESVVRFSFFTLIAEDATPFRSPLLLGAFRSTPGFLAQLIWSLFGPPRWLLRLIWVCVTIGLFADFRAYTIAHQVAQVLTLAGIGWGVWKKPVLPTSGWAAMATAVVYARGTSAGITLAGLPSIDSLGYAGGIRFSLYPLVLGAFSVLMTLDLIRKLVRDREEKLRLVADLEAARTVQRMLLPAAGLPGVECVYEPAQVVGGDFYFAQSTADGSVLVVAGDVSGKGLKAAMVVSLITGMLDRRHADSPAALLAELNRALCTRLEGGFVTCCIVRLGPEGRILVANAGHPAPYLDGHELDLSPGLPLGVVPEAEYTETTFSFAGQLTLVSDGVIEAANAPGELFGFDRTRAISTQSAQGIAEAAKQWGQNDDITVVTVRRSA